jgi:phage shock protein E
VLVLAAAACGDDPGPSVADAAPAVDGSAGAGVDVEASPVQVISPQAGKALIDEGLTLIDVRTPAEFDEARLDGALLIDIASPEFGARLAELDPSQGYVVYCRSGNRSAVAAAQMADMGFVEVYDMGGIIDWQAAGLPIVTG